ncbi:MAG: hypothetical protein J0M35_12150 [Candidatus Obscuribacter phosphatis]|uniref:Uncharacterized protein n=1 Tax=Candidatus Obscuribacter phosphatis TaxID=1906157 RepID=A0A8J7PLZ1_9BACT|nr:hypothetical protein [Candidatus Obscuribacter phosphatis]
MPPCAAARANLELKQADFVLKKTNKISAVSSWPMSVLALLASYILLPTFLAIFCQSPAQAEKPAIIRSKESDKQEQVKKEQERKEDEAKVKVWKIHQSGDVLGERFLYISADSFKAFYPKAHYAISASAPDWKIHFFNIDRRTIYSTTIESFNKRLSLRARANAQSFYPYKYKIVPGKPKLIAGEKTYCLTCQSAEPTNKDAVKRSDFYLAERIALPPRMQEFFKPSWGAAMCKNQPLRIDLELGDGRRSNKLDTKSIVLELLPRKFFEPPSGYKKTQSEEEVLIGDGIINDIIGDLGKRLGSDESDRSYRKDRNHK